MHRLPHLSQIAPHAVAFVIAEGNQMVYRGMALEERAEVGVEYKVDGGVGKRAAQRVEHHGRKDGVAHLAKADDEDVHAVWLIEMMNDLFSTVLPGRKHCVSSSIWSRTCGGQRG